MRISKVMPNQLVLTITIDGVPAEEPSQLLLPVCNNFKDSTRDRSRIERER